VDQPVGADATMKYLTIINNEQFEIEIDSDGNILLNGEPRTVDFLPLGSSLFSIITDNQSLQVVIEEDQGNYQVLMAGRLYEGQVLDERALLMAQRKGTLSSGGGELHSPMPGLIVSVEVHEGQEVSLGATVVILESMKMQNELKAPADGIVKSIHVKTGQIVDKNSLLLEIEPPQDDD
jgi:biotin carboxyl carrier protein